jgi:glycosyltransferase involved in cell wall biosynthesis
MYHEILPRMCELDDALSIDLLVSPRSLKQPLPEHPHISSKFVPKVHKYLRPWRLWKPILPKLEQFLERNLYLRWSERGTNRIWHPTYYKLPPEGWKGKYVVTVFDMIHEKGFLNGPYRGQNVSLKDACIRHADAIICISETTRRDLIEIYNDTKLSQIHTIPLAAYGRTSMKQHPKIFEDPFILYVGGRGRYKAFSTLAKAYAVWAHRRDVKLVLVGSSLTPEESQLFVKLGISKDVRVCLHVGDEELIAFYTQALAFVHTSLYEGFGLPLLEAMACGCRVIATDIPSTREVAGNVPIYFEPGDFSSLLQGLNTVYDEYGNNERVLDGYRQARQYSWDKTAAKTLKVYQSLL